MVSGNITISQCTITANTLTNQFNTYGAGLCVLITATASGHNNVFYGNIAPISPDVIGYTYVTYSLCSNLLPGLGNIAGNPLLVAGAPGAYCLSQVAAGQSANSPCLDAGDPAAPMVIGTTRTDQVQDSGLVDMGYHYPILLSAPIVEITLTPVNPPIVIPAPGGNFNFNAALDNNQTAPQTLDVWIMVQLPNLSWYGPVLGPITLTLPASFTLIRTRTQTVPASAPAGNYVYEGRVGDYPGIIWDSDSFPFTKSITGAGPWVSDWSCSGEEIGETEIPIITHHSSLITSCAPDPFNPTTTISYALPQSGHVTLTIYDLRGREVARMVDDWREAGSHVATFDGSALASGVYVYRLTANGRTASAKMILMK